MDKGKGLENFVLSLNRRTQLILLQAFFSNLQIPVYKLLLHYALKTLRITKQEVKTSRKKSQMVKTSR